MAMVKTTNIQNRNGTLYFRIKVPVNCREALGGKQEVTKSLRLKEDEMAEAIVQAGLLATEWNETFRSIRKTADGKQLPVAVPGSRPVTGNQATRKVKCFNPHGNNSGVEVSAELSLSSRKRRE